MDYTQKPYSEWLESTLLNLFALDPQSIGIVMITSDDIIATSYFNATRVELGQMRDAIDDDRLSEWVRSNADYITSLLSGEEDDDCQTE